MKVEIKDEIRKREKTKYFLHSLYHFPSNDTISKKNNEKNQNRNIQRKVLLS